MQAQRYAHRVLLSKMTLPTRKPEEPKLNDHECILETKTKPEVSEAFRVNEVGSLHVCTIRTGLFAGLPGFIGQPATRLHKPQCVHRGDPVCRFVFNYSSHRIRDTGVRLSVVSH